jgi:type I restriction enzyme M protein
MPTESSAIVQKLWNYCNVLRDDGVSYGDYVEQLTYLVFLKMADEQTKPPLNKKSNIPKDYNWESLIRKDGVELEVHYRNVLEKLGKEKGMIGVIFRKSQNKIQDPAKLKRLLTLIGGETWLGLDIDVKGEIYEGLLQKNAEDVKSGAGQYFTPRGLIKAIIEVMKPQAGKTIFDPARGTGGFLLVAHDYISSHNPNLNKEQKQFLMNGTVKGKDIVDSVARLCAMNLYLHGIGGEESPIDVGDALVSEPSEHYDMVLTNPPFGKKSSVTVTNGDGETNREALTYSRNDFWASSTSNKQLNFVQHVWSLLKIHGSAAVVVPDNVLFEGGAGEIIRRNLLQACNVHTLLRLPTGVFYAQGVKANVLFFDKKPAAKTPWTETLWIYDLRTNMHFTLKTNPLMYEDLQDFISCYNAENKSKRKESERFHSFSYDKLMERDKVNLDIFWLRDESLEDSDNLPDPDVIALEIAENLQDALEQFSGIVATLGQTKD